MQRERECALCGETFGSIRPSHRFCSDTCKAEAALLVAVLEGRSHKYGSLPARLAAATGAPSLLPAGCSPRLIADGRSARGAARSAMSAAKSAPRWSACASAANARADSMGRVPLDLLDMTDALAELLGMVGCAVEVVVRDESGDEIVMLGPARFDRAAELWSDPPAFDLVIGHAGVVSVGGVAFVGAVAHPCGSLALVHDHVEVLVVPLTG